MILPNLNDAGIVLFAKRLGQPFKIVRAWLDAMRIRTLEDLRKRYEGETDDESFWDRMRDDISNWAREQEPPAIIDGIIESWTIHSPAPETEKPTEGPSPMPAAVEPNIGHMEKSMKPTKKKAAPKKAASKAKPKKPAAKASAAKPKAKAEAAPKGKRAAVLAAAQSGKLPQPPDFGAKTHERFRAKLAEIEAAAKSGDLKALEAFEINPVSSSPKAMARYRDLCVIAVKARAKAE